MPEPLQLANLSHVEGTNSNTSGLALFGRVRLGLAVVESLTSLHELGLLVQTFASCRSFGPVVGQART